MGRTTFPAPRGQPPPGCGLVGRRPFPAPGISPVDDPKHGTPEWHQASWAAKLEADALTEEMSLRELELPRSLGYAEWNRMIG